MTDPLHGKQVNNFTIRERIGQGGMATVYRAYQPSVNREVALKIITLNAVPGERDEFRLRFAQEAQVIAGLEHAHILPVYDYGIVDNEIAYIAMRLLRGGTLGERLVDQPLELNRAAEVFSQIALGLSYAHRKGVIHRDLKPGNIMFDESEFAYLTDFGLAKMVENALSLTRTDAIVGTPTYMSPEQLRGTPLDSRSDIYSLGCVLYHMLVGHQPFADSATSIVSIIYQQLEKDPTPPHELNPLITPAVEQVILRALKKDRDDRFLTAEEMATALNKAVGRDLRSAEPEVKKPVSTAFFTGDDLISRIPDATVTLPPSSPQTPPAPPAQRSTSAPRWLIPGAIVLVLVIAAVVALGSGVLSPSSSASTPTLAPTSVVALANTETPTLPPTEAASLEPTTVPVVANTETPTLPPTETQQPTSAVSPTPLVERTQRVVAPGSGAGEIAFVSNRDGNNEIYVMNSDGSNARRLTDDPNSDTDFTWSPDGSQILYSSYDSAGSIENFLMNADGSNPQPVTAWFGWNPAWSPDGTKIVFGAYGDLTGDIFVIDLDGSNRQTLTSNDYDEGYPNWSPDGAQIVFAIRRDGVEDIYIMDADGGNLRGLTDDPASDLYPVWSPDGTQIAFQSDREGFSKVYLIDIDGNNLHPLSTDPGDSYTPSWSPDGSQIAFSSYRESNASEIYISDADGTNIQRLTDNDTEDTLPEWRP